VSTVRAGIKGAISTPGGFKWPREWRVLGDEAEHPDHRG
jgi:hypothetical protein